MELEEETIAVRPGEEFDLQKVEAYLREHVEGLGEGRLFVRQFPSGASNLTYLLRVGDWEGVLRRPPFGPLPPRAHDMQREAGLLQKISPVFPLAPRPYVFCDDLSILGAPFYVMERRKGIVLNDSFPPDVTVNDALCQCISETVVDTLVQIHAIDWQTAGLSELGHPVGFLERQVKSWIERYFRAQTDDIPQVEPLTRCLAANIPASPAPTLIHNDFKLNNMLLAEQDLGRAVAVLDWEMATIGDPLFDLAISLSYWVTGDDPEELRSILPVVTHHPGFINREQFMQLYARKSGRDLSSMHFYMTFAYFKLAVILQQIYVRWKRGQTQDPRFSAFGTRVRNLILHAASLAEAGKL
ncbi:MAG TPA: phosphotransferase family protein [Ktedonobacteraceae bacterium]|nr:phosphotransferase family protein [Ktedonobacteraceae bacterium]